MLIGTVVGMNPQQGQKGRGAVNQRGAFVPLEKGLSAMGRDVELGPVGGLVGTSRLLCMHGISSFVVVGGVQR